jgi:hypothetical protein
MKYHALALFAALLAASPAHAQHPAEPSAHTLYAREEEEDLDELIEFFYRISTSAFAMSNGTLMYLNLRREDSPDLRRVWGGLAAVNGGLQMAAGAGGVGDSGTRPYGIFNLAFGTATAALGIRTLLRPDASARPLAATPLTTPDGAIGLAATLRF